MQGYKPGATSAPSQLASNFLLTLARALLAFSASQTDMSTRASVDTDPINNEKGIVQLSPAERARLLRKLDWHLLPLVSLLYLLSFL